MDWKDTLLPGASRTPWERSQYPGGPPVQDESGYGFVLDMYGNPTFRNDWVAGPGGVPVISGSSEAHGYGGGPSPGFFPVDPGNYHFGSYGGRESDPTYRGYYNSLQQGGYFNSQKKDLRQDPAALMKVLAAMSSGGDYSALLKQLGYS